MTFLSLIENRVVGYFNEKRSLYWMDSMFHLFFAILLYWSVVYFRERVIPYDGAWYCFNLVNFKTFFFPHGRWGLAPCQLPALIAVKNHFSLKNVLIIYSSTVIIYNYLFFIIIRYVFKNSMAAFALILSLCLTYRYTFFFSPSDIQPAIGPTLLFFTTLFYWTNSENRTLKIINLFLSILLCFWIANIHLVFMMAIVFILLFVGITTNAYKKPQWWLILITGSLFFFWNILTVKEGSYQAQKMPSIQIIIEQLPVIWKLTSAKFFYFFSLKYYLPFYLVFSAVVWYGFQQKKYIPAIFTFVYIVSFVLLVIITYYKGESPIMQETYYILLGLLISIPFVSWVMPFLSPLKKVAIMLVLIVVNLNAIYACKSQIDRRFQFENMLIDYGNENKTQKMFISKSNFDNEIVWADWDLCFESLFLSTLKNNYTITFASQFDSINNNNSINDNRKLIGPPFYAVLDQQVLNSDYFNLAASNYHILNKVPEIKTDSIKNNISINFTQVESVFYRKGCYVGKVFIPIAISNTSNQFLPSIFKQNNGLHFSYRLKKMDSSEFKNFEYNLSPVSRDIEPKSKSNELMVIKIPNRSGTYHIIASLYYGNTLLAQSEKYSITVK